MSGPATFVVAAGCSGRWIRRARTDVPRVEAAGIQAPRFRSGSDVAQAAAEPLADGQRRSACRWTRRTTSGSFIAARIARAQWRSMRRRIRQHRRVLRCPRRRCSSSIEAGNLIGHWGGPGQGYDWPESNHGITVDYKGNVWIGGNGRAARAQPSSRLLHDNMILKFTQDGKFLMQIGKPGESKGSNDTDERQGSPPRCSSIRRPTKLYRRRRLRQPSRDRVRRRHRQVQAALGRLRQQARRHARSAATIRTRRRRSSSAIPVHCAELSNDGLLYVCDRPNDRIQVFKPDGTFVKEIVHREEHARRRFGLGHRLLEGPAAEISSTWPTAQTRRSTSSMRASLEILTSFGDGGRQPGEFYARAQHRDGFQGQHLHHRDLSRPARAEVSCTRDWLPVTKKDQGVVWPTR